MLSWAVAIIVKVPLSRTTLLLILSFRLLLLIVSESNQSFRSADPNGEHHCFQAISVD
jgi:hypothetical protein